MSEKKYLLTVDEIIHQSKPVNVGKVSNQLRNKVNYTIEEFAKFVSAPFSYTWSGGDFNGKINNDNWLKQSVFGLDFDDGKISIEGVYERLNIYNIVPQAWYYSFSHSVKLAKFRVVLFLEEPVENSEIHRVIADGLLALFPEADKKCSARARFYYGGKGATIIHTEPLPIQNLIQVCSAAIISADSGRSRNLPIEELNDINSFGKKYQNLYNLNRSEHKLPKKRKSTNGLAKKLEMVDFEKAEKNIKIFERFMAGDWLYHNELFGLATNLIEINGGALLMKKTMEKYNNEGKAQYTDNNFKILTYLKKVYYPPYPIYKFSRYEEDADLFDFISAVKDVRGKIITLKDIPKIELKDAELRFEDEFNRVIKTGEIGKIYLFKLPTAIGKTQALINVNAIIAAPTNALKNEIYKRMEIYCCITPDPIKFKRESINRRIANYYAIGNNVKPIKLISSIADCTTDEFDKEDVEKAKRHIEQLHQSYQSDSTILTTHQRTFYSSFNNDTLIYDEDPLSNIIQIKKVHISDLFELNQVVEMNVIKDMINELLGVEQLDIQEFNYKCIDIENLIKRASDVKFESNIIEFFTSSYYMKDGKNPNCIHYVIQKDLLLNKKIIILSATIPTFFYEQLYKDRIEIIDISDVQQQGKIVQYTNRSYSRASLKKNHEKISKIINDKPVITFLKNKDYFKNPVNDMHFGNCSGYDSLKGKNIAIVGTPHHNNIEYLLTAKILGIEFTSDDTAMKYENVEYNDFRFKFVRFENENLRKVQFSLIESDLIQSIGRARTLRTDAKVEVYSNYPLRISDEFIY